MAESTTHHAPPKPDLAVEGVFADPDMTLGTDPRVMKEVVAHIEAQGDACAPLLSRPPNIIEGLAQADTLAALPAIETGYGGLFDMLVPDVDAATMETLEEQEVVIAGVDDNDIALFITAPKREGPFPVVLHTHGGGMTFMRAGDSMYVRWRRQLASKGIIVVGVDFRNVGGSNGDHPFPAGLNDCWSAAQWVHAHLDTFPTTARPTRQLVVSGESGGGNLCLATALKACKEGKHIISGVYSMCPYIAGPVFYDRAGERAKELPSLFENDGLLLSVDMMRDLARLYTDDVTNPLAWPLFASQEDLKDMPPTVISVNEADALRDEGRMMFRKLSAAGVVVSGKVVLGTQHAGDMMLPHGSLCTDVTLNSIASFASSRTLLP